MTGVVLIFASFAAAVIGRLAPEQAALFVGTGASLALLGRSLDLGGK